MERGEKTREREKPSKGDIDKREGEDERGNVYIKEKEEKLRGKNYIFKIAFFNKTENNYKMIISSC